MLKYPYLESSSNDNANEAQWPHEKNASLWTEGSFDDIVTRINLREDIRRWKLNRPRVTQSDCDSFKFWRIIIQICLHQVDFLLVVIIISASSQD